MSFFSRLILAVSICVATGNASAHPVLRQRCVAWLKATEATRPLTRDSAPGRWAQASQALPPRSLESIGLLERARAQIRSWMTGATNPAAVDDAKGDPAEVVRRLGRVQSDLMTLQDRQIVLNHVVYGRENIRRYLEDVISTSAGTGDAGAPVTNPATLRGRRFTTDALSGTIYAGIASLFGVVAIEQLAMHRGLSFALSLATAVASSGRAQTYFLNVYLNVRNGLGVANEAPRNLDELLAADTRHVSRVLALLERDEANVVAYQGLDVPLALSALAADRYARRVAPTVDQIVGTGARWPADPRRLVKDQILYFDVNRREHVLLTFVREVSYPQDPVLFH